MATRLYVRGLDRTHTVDVGQEDTLAQLKEVLSSVTGVAIGDQVLSVGGVPLDKESDTLCNLGLQHMSTIDLAVRLLGGKVHGSLARAGKVRGQTPKVEPQEKKKKKTGRAMRRIQYNRRFVNVAVVGPGRRRGPNANS